MAQQLRLYTKIHQQYPSGYNPYTYNPQYSDTNRTSLQQRHLLLSKHYWWAPNLFNVMVIFSPSTIFTAYSYSLVTHKMYSFCCLDNASGRTIWDKVASTLDESWSYPLSQTRAIKLRRKNVCSSIIG